MNRIILSSGLFSKYPEFSDYKQVLNFIAQHKNWFYELIIYPNWEESLSQCRDIILKKKLPVVSVHADKTIATLLSNKSSFSAGYKKLKQNLIFAEEINAEYIVFHLWEKPRYEENIDEILKILQYEKNKYLKKTRISIETVPSNTIEIVALLNQCLTYIPDATITLDTELFSWISNLNKFFKASNIVNKLLNVHIRDYDGKPFDDNRKRRYLPIGAGKIDFDQLFQQLQNINFQGNLTIESSLVDEKGNVLVNEIEEEIQKVRHLML